MSTNPVSVVMSNPQASQTIGVPMYEGAGALPRPRPSYCLRAKEQGTAPKSRPGSRGSTSSVSCGTPTRGQLIEKRIERQPSLILLIKSVHPTHKVLGGFLHVLGIDSILKGCQSFRSEPSAGHESDTWIGEPDYSLPPHT